MMKWFVLFVGLIASGCVAQTSADLPPNVHVEVERVPAQLAADLALVVMGFSTMLDDGWFGVAEPLIGAWGEIEPISRELVMPVPNVISWKTSFGIGAEDAVRGGKRYMMYVVPAGTYSMTWIQRGLGALYFPTEFASFRARKTVRAGILHDFEFSKEARALPNAPTLSVEPGETLYVGDLYLDFPDDDLVRWSVKRSDDDLAKFLKDRTINEWTVRLMRRADGAMIKDGDGVRRRL